MAKKQVAVSLRKPPSPEKVDAFVTGAAAEKPAPTTDSRETTPDQHHASTRAGGSEAPPAKAADVAGDHVNGAATAPTEALAVPQEPAVTPVLIGTDGRARRAFTVYLSDALADRLVLHCIEQDRDMSNFVGEAVQEQLEKRLGPAVSVSTHAGPTVNEVRDTGPAPGAAYRSEPYRHSEPPASQTKVDRFFQVSRVLVTLWRQRPWG